MNRKLSVLMVSVGAFVLGMTANNFAISKAEFSNFNVATVDVQKVVSESAQVKALKQAQLQKRQDLITFVKNARADVSKVSDKKAKQDLEDKYNKQLNDMRNSMDSEYQKKLHEIDNNITKVISKQAKENNYNVVLSKNIVLYGGEDITSKVAAEVK